MSHIFVEKGNLERCESILVETLSEIDDPKALEVLFKYFSRGDFSEKVFDSVKDSLMKCHSVMDSLMEHHSDKWLQLMIIYKDKYNQFPYSTALSISLQKVHKKYYFTDINSWNRLSERDQQARLFARDEMLRLKDGPKFEPREVSKKLTRVHIFSEKDLTNDDAMAIIRKLCPQAIATSPLPKITYSLLPSWPEVVPAFLVGLFYRLGFRESCNAPLKSRHF